MKYKVTVLSILLFAAALNAQESGKYWIFFTDKGRQTSGITLKKEMEHFSHLNKRALKRRAKVKNEQNLVDRYDLPVYTPYITALKDLSIAPVITSRWLNAVSANLTEAQAERMFRLDFVRDIKPVATAQRPKPDIDNSLMPSPAAKATDHMLDYGFSATQNNLIKVPQVHDLRINGRGVRIGMLDTGFRHDYHTAFDSLDVIAEYDVINQDSVTQDEGAETKFGQHNHGTKSLSCIAAYGPGGLIGPAFGAEFLLAKTEVTGSEKSIEEDYWVAGLEWEEAKGADIVSSSLGYTAWYTYSDMDGNTAVTTVAADIAASKGVLVVNSAGNEADDPWFYMNAPADGDSVLAVGAVYNNGFVTNFSSRGPTYDGRIKPDVMAMGSSVTTVEPSDSVLYYLYSGGTSFSCPQVAGVAALVLAAHPQLTPMQIRDALRETADNAANPDSLYGWGIVNAWDAVLYHGPAFSTQPTAARLQQGGLQISISVASKTNIASDGVTLHWSYDPANFQNTVIMTPSETSHEYRAVVSGTTGDVPLYYYFTVKDMSTSVFSYPHDAPNSFFSTVSGTPVIPQDFTLYPAYPNPFSPASANATRISFTMQVEKNLSLEIYNVLGQRVRTLQNYFHLSGFKYYFSWNGLDEFDTAAPAGVYFYKLKGTGISKTAKLVKLQ